MLAALTTLFGLYAADLDFRQIRGAYLAGGSILAFFLGYSMLFFKAVSLPASIRFLLR